MTSKSSFLGSLKENSKRRLWVWAVAILSYMLILPLTLAMRLSRVSQQMKYMVEAYGVAKANEIVHGNMLDVVRAILGPSEMLMLFAVVFAVANAVQGFSWLYSRKKIDFYMGMPVKRSKRFLVIWLNGIFIYIIPYIMGLMISMLIAAGNHALDAGVVTIIVQTFLVNLLFYLCVYHMAMFAVMLTGNVVITGMGFLVFCLYEWVVRRVDYGYRMRHFRYFSGSRFQTVPLFSPFSMYSELLSDPAVMMSQTKVLVEIVAFAIVLGVLSYVCYLKRPAEGAGKALVFPVTKPVIKILLVVPMALLMGGLIADEVNYEPLQEMGGSLYVVVALALVTIIGSAIIQVIYEFDIKGVVHQKRHILISGILVALIFCIYRYDLLHYDSYIPSPEKVESVAFFPSNYQIVDYGNAWMDESGGTSGLNYVDQYMYLTNTEDVYDLVKHSMDQYDKVFPKGESVVYDETEEQWSQWSASTIIYRMKSGKEVVRKVWTDVNDAQTGEYLDRIIGSQEFKEGYLMGASDRLKELISKPGEFRINAYYGNAVYQEKMLEEEILAFLECYQADMKKFNFTSVKESVPQGIITITFEKEINNGYRSGTMSTELAFNVYPFFDKSVACLKEFGYYMERQVDIADVDRIYITNRNSETYQELYEQQKMMAEVDANMSDKPMAVAETVDGYYGDSDIDTRGYADYTDREDIEKLADCLYVDRMLTSRWDGGADKDYDYTVLVYFKPDSEMNRKFGTTAYYSFREGEVPDFVQEDTAYQMTE